MSAFIRRYTDFPSLALLTAIEAVNIIDLAPQGAFLGVGSGTLLTVGEFEDGPFAAGGDSPDYVNPASTIGLTGQQTQSILEVFSDPDLKRKYGGFGFTHDGSPSSAPCARRRMGEFWNGNGYLKMKGLRALRSMVARVDTSVGQVAFFPLAAVEGSIRGPFSLTAADVLTATSDQGGPASSTALAGVAATITGGAIVATGFVGGEQISAQVDGGSPVIVVFTSADQTAADVAARINDYVGATVATVSGGNSVKFDGFIPGTDSSIVLADVTTGALTAIGHAPGTTAGTGNVGNLFQVQASELATIINATVALNAIDVKARATTDGRLVVYSTSTAGGEITITSTAISIATGLSTTLVEAGSHGGGTIPAGTRVQTVGGAEWVTMQTLTIRAGETFTGGLNVGPHTVKVRPSLDDGTALGTAAATVVVVATNDQPTFALFGVTNPQALTAARTEPQVDVAYGAVFTKTLSITAPSRISNFMISARRSPTVVTTGRQSVIDASANGCFGRKFITRSPLAYGADAAIADVALYRSDRVYYTTVPLLLYSEEIAARGVAGGAGFTENGVIEVGADTALATLCCSLAPEEDPGQLTALLGAWLGTGAIANDYDINTYTAFRRAGICAPRMDTLVAGLFFQSGVTSSTDTGRTEIQRRNMADFVQDSLAVLALPYSKKNPTKQIQSAFIGDVTGFMDTLLSPEVPERARIVDYQIDATSGNSPELAARGVYVLIVRVRTLSSMKFIEIPVEIGAGVVIQDLAA